MTHAPSPIPAEEPISFTPAPCSRNDGWTAKRQREFIYQLSRIGLVAPAAKAVGKSRQSAYRLREREGAEGFAAAWDSAIEMGEDNAEGHAIDRALEGYDVPYFYGGRQRGVTRRYNDRLLIAALARAGRRAERPRKEASTGSK